MIRFFVAVAASAMMLALASTAAVPAPPAPEEKESLYFPTKVGDTAVYLEGDKEFTETVTKVEEVEGAKIVSIDRGSRGKVITPNYQRVKVSAKGVALVELYGTKFDPLLWELQLPAKVGSKWKFERDADDGKYFDVRVIESVEAVEVPAGKYMAVKVVRSRTLDNRQFAVQWYAPRVGLVKSEYRTDFRGLETRVLKSFSPGKRPTLSEYLAVGAILSGDFRNENSESGGIATLTVTERDGTTVKGVLVTRHNDRPKDTPSAEWKIKGRIDGTQFQFDADGSNRTKATVTLSLKEGSLEGTFVTGTGSKGNMSLKGPIRRGPDSRVTKIRFPDEDVVLSCGERAPVFVVGLTTASAALEAPQVYIGDGEVALQLRADESKGLFFQGNIPMKSGDKFGKGSTVEVRPGFKWAQDLKSGDVYVILPGVKFVRPKE